MTKKHSTRHILTPHLAVVQHSAERLLLLPSTEDSILVFRNISSIAVLMGGMSILTRAMPITGCRRHPHILVIQFHRSQSIFKGAYWQRPLQQHYNDRVRTGHLA
jgi:hypothetical protein